MRIVAWNHGAEQYLGWAAEDAIGRSIAERLQPTCTLSAREKKVADLLRNLAWVGTTVLKSRWERHVPFGGYCHPAEKGAARGLEFLSVLSPLRSQKAEIGYVEPRGLDIVVSRVVAAYELKANPSANSEKLTREPLTRELHGGLISELGCDSVPVTTPIPPTIQGRLRGARERADLTIYALAHLAGVAEYQIRTWEMSPSDPRSHKISPENLGKLLPHIGGTSDYYFYGAPDGKP
jgi:PAS domain-containing protein